MSANPVYSPFFGAMGASAAMIFSGKWRERAGRDGRVLAGWIHFICHLKT